MPQVQFIDQPNIGGVIGQFGSGFLGEVTEKYKQRQEEDAMEKLLSGIEPGTSEEDVLKQILGARGVSGEKKQSVAGLFSQARTRATAQQVQTEKVEREKEKFKIQTAQKEEELRIKEKGVDARKSKLPEEAVDRIKDDLIGRGWDESDANLFINGTPGVQQILVRKYNELEDRGIIGPRKEMQEGGAEVEGAIADEQPPEPEWPKINPPSRMTMAENRKWEDKNQRENNKILAAQKEKESGFKNTRIRLNQLKTFGEKIPEGVGKIIINPFTGEPYGVAKLAGLVNKETQAFTKTLNDFLVDAKKFFGARVSNFEIQAFKERLPSLLNTKAGRDLIVNQMSLMNDLELLHSEGLNNGIKHYGKDASYSDIVSVVDVKTEAREQEIITQINQLEKASDYMDMMAKNPKRYEGLSVGISPSGEVKVVPKDKLEKAKARNWVIY